MALNKATLEASIRNAFKSMQDAGGDEEQALNTFCSKLSDAMDAYVKSAEIVYVSGLTASTYPVLGEFKGNLK